MPSYICVDTAVKDAFRKATGVTHWTPPEREILKAVTEDQASHTAAMKSALTELEALESYVDFAVETQAGAEGNAKGGKAQAAKFMLRLALTKLEAQVAQEATSRETILAQEEARNWALKMQELKAERATFMLRLALTKLEAQVAQEATSRETILAQEEAHNWALKMQELKAQEKEVREQHTASQLAAMKSTLTKREALRR